MNKAKFVTKAAWLVWGRCTVWRNDRICTTLLVHRFIDRLVLHTGRARYVVVRRSSIFLEAYAQLNDSYEVFKSATISMDVSHV